MDRISVIKASGKKDVFSNEKLHRSLKRSGVSNEIANEIVQEITAHLTEEMSTKSIYKQAFQLLKQYSRPGAARYKLKQAINALGPSGFPFELFIAELLKSEGYTVQTDVIVQGHCVRHEVDVIAQKENKQFMVECKFHNSQGICTDVKVPLYIQSRFLDLTRKGEGFPERESPFHKAWLVTNTRFSEDAILYGTCMNIDLVSWDYPRHFSLRDRINKAGLHPLTCLLSLTGHEKQLLLNKRVVLCKQLSQQPELLQEIGIGNTQRVAGILTEVEQVCQKKILQHKAGV
ncbi:restriction endonuclease [Flavisolibacter nicotianae]|uniref:restriction endonuclease n=1 Tax=Flavisolibacter nicotianae TaxID=2364882 RepID=UPI000EAD5A28|nr:restriction endonuclease [Flavisolibacter nicotianae]